MQNNVPSLGLECLIYTIATNNFLPLWIFVVVFSPHKQNVWIGAFPIVEAASSEIPPHAVVGCHPLSPYFEISID